MHLAYLVTAPGIPVGGASGASRHIHALIDALVVAGHRVTLVAARSLEGPDGLPPARLLLLPPLHRSWLARTWGSLGTAVPRGAEEAWQARAFMARALPWLQQDPPDLLLERYCLFSQAGLLLKQALQKPLVLEVNAPLRLERARYEGLSLRHPRAEAEVHGYERTLLQGADRVLVVSSPLKRYVEEHAGVSPARVRVVMNGSSAVRGAAIQGDGADLPSSWPEGGSPVVACMGSLKPWHGLRSWAEVFARARQQVPLLQGRVIGAGPGRAALEAELEARGCRAAVTFTGQLAQAEAWKQLQACTLLLAPYPRLEPFYFCPLKVVEALRLGVPVISSLQGDLPTLVGQGGKLLEPDDEAGLAQAVVEGVTQPDRLAHWRKEALQQGQTLTWRRAVEALEELGPAQVRQTGHDGLDATD